MGARLRESTTTSDDVAALRRRAQAVAHPHHHAELRRVADSVPDDTLRLTPDQVAERYAADWKAILSV